MFLLLPLILIPLLFFAAAIAKQKIRFFAWLCPVCAGVLLTWVILLVAFFMGASVDPLAIGVLMGMSVTGAMSKLEMRWKQKGMRHAWLMRLVVLIGGFYTVVFVIKERWDAALLFALASLLLLVIVGVLMQKPSGDGKQARHLDKCC